MKDRLPISILLLLLAGLAAAAAPPDQVNYQGVLRDSAGAPRNGSFDMVFGFYSASSAGDQILVDSHTTSAGGQVTVSNGLFTVALGSGTVTDGTGPGTYTSLAAAFRSHAAVWLEIRIGGETLSPRVRVVSSAYSLSASSLQGIVNVDGSGSVGIGTPTPSTSVDIAFPGTPVLTLQTTSDGGADATLRIEGSRDTSSSNDVSAVEFHNDNGLGTPFLGARIAMRNSDSSAATSNADLVVSTNDGASVTEKLRILADGRVGIGTASPGAPLAVAGPLATTSIETREVGYLVRPTASGVKNANSAGFLVGSFESGQNGRARLDINLSGNPGSGNNWGLVPEVTVMTLQANGNVGVGNSAPAYRLDVAGSARVTGALHDSSGDAGADGQVLRSTGAGTNWVSPSTLSDGDWTISGSNLHSAVSGNVGIGTDSPNIRLTVVGSGANSELIQLRDGSDVNQWHLNLRSGGLNVSESGVSDFRLFLQDGGKVGIGTSAPSARLTVQDSLAVSTWASEVRAVHSVAGSAEGENSGGIVWQSFLAPYAGRATVVMIDCRSPENGVSAAVTLSIREGEGLGGALLTTEIVTVPDSWEQRMFTFQAPPALSAGQTYTLVFNPGTVDQAHVNVDYGNPYTLGSMNGYADEDMRFSVYLALDTGVGFKVNSNGSVGIRTEQTLGYALAVNGTAAKAGGGSWSSYSDRRLKDVAGDFTPGLDAIRELRAYRYSYRPDNPAKLAAKGSFVGPLAQEVLEVLPEAVETADGGWLLVNDEPILWAMVNAIRELDLRSSAAAGSGRGETGGAIAPPVEAVPKDGDVKDRPGLPEPQAAAGGAVAALPVSADVEPGDVLVIVPDDGPTLQPCLAEADPMVAGIATSERSAGEGTAVVAGAGFAFVKADATLFPIARGDLLVSSPLRGHAMKARPEASPAGTILGKALEPLPSGTGRIRILILAR